jgi:hypothetical protein
VPSGPGARAVYARVEQSAPSAPSAQHPSSVPVETARAAVPVRGEVGSHGERSDGCAPPASTPAVGPRLPSGATFAAAVRARTLEASHAVAARGALLPYFPTAPPRPS